MDKNVQRAMLKNLGWNLLAGFIGVLPLFFLQGDAVINWGFILLIIAAFSLIIQLVMAIVNTTIPEKKHTGQGMLMSLGIILLLGLCVCGSMIYL